MENKGDTPGGLTDSRPVAVIILNWNGAKLLRRFLPAVVATTDTRISRLIVADNGSTDESVEVLKNEFPTVELMRFDKNYGFAEGYNKALSLVDNEYVVLLNSDVATTEGWDAELLAFMEDHPGVGACQPKIKSYDRPDYFEYAGAAGGFLDRNGYPYCRGRIFGTCERDEGQYDTPMDVMWASGAAFMVRRQIYLRCGGLDPLFFAHMEEIDLCWRLRLAGYGIAAVPSAVVYHLGGGSLPAENPRKTYLNFRNNLLMLYKNLPPSEGRRFLIKRRLLDTIAFVKYALTFDFANAAAIVKAHRDYARMKRHYNPGAPTNLLADGPGAGIDILGSYYLKGRRRFADL